MLYVPSSVTGENRLLIAVVESPVSEARKESFDL